MSESKFRTICAALMLATVALAPGCSTLAEESSPQESSSTNPSAALERGEGRGSPGSEDPGGQTRERSVDGIRPNPDAGKEDAPNVVLLSVDDLDDHSLEYMPRLQSLLVERGTSFENAFVTDPLCCPSRATTLTGQYSHNTGIRGNQPPQGGFEKFYALGREYSTFPTWLDEAGYSTGYFGKYMNGYKGTYVPPGWDEWHVVSGNYASSAVNHNGQVVSGQQPPSLDTDRINAQSQRFLAEAAVEDKPFFAYLAPRAPHEPATPPERHRGAFAGAELPKPPSFNERDVSDKPQWLQRRPPLTQQQVRRMEGLHERRMASMLAVDDMIGDTVETLQKNGELDNTYIIFTSDNGFHMGQHRLPIGKWTPYEEDINVPLVVRGPGVPAGESREHFVLNNDFAPTFADIVGLKVPNYLDGRSFLPLLGDTPPPTTDWRRAFLVEAGRFYPGAGAGPPLGRPRLDAIRSPDHLYVEYETGERELYDLHADPHQLQNLLKGGDVQADPEIVRRLDGRLEALRGCAGDSCREAEGGRSE